MTTALLLGGARCLQDDLAGALEVLGRDPDVWVACNHAARDRRGRVDHFVSMHIDQLPRWIREREALGQPPAGRYWTANHRAVLPGLDVSRAPNWGGSSGLLMVAVGLELGLDRMILCGVPLDPEEAHYDDARRWTDAGNYRRGWTMHTEVLEPCVRSMSGWTRKLLGAPTKEWLDA